MTPAELVRKARVTAKLTQGQLAEKLGIALNSVSRWELGQQEPSYAHLLAVAEATGHRLILEIKRGNS